MNEQSLFIAALEKPIDGREKFLSEACPEQPELRGRVQRLLAAHENAERLMARPAVAVEPTIDQPQERPGTKIGRYKLLEQIGEGGMGTVWVAEQTEPVRRRVALKLIKPGMDSRQVLSRFDAERQALALMDHPNIARVIDGGTTDAGRPYFVMDLVRGVPITRYCDEHHLTPRQRLELFLPVSQAIQHAHQKGIIHRDIKPTNILVTEYDEKPVPKVIDFGVAKAISQSLTEKTMFTGLGQIVGTLEYMSPEQAKVNQLDIDTRSDIYALGVLLYELLTGSTPFDQARLRTLAFDETLRIIREEDPPKPSTRLSTSDTLAKIAAVRGTEPARLTKLLRGELDWIVLKCLEKDRNRRYESASGLARDMQRYLHNEPVIACPPSHWYRFRKRVQRNRAIFAAAIASAVAVLLGLATLAASNYLIRQEQARTQQQKERAEQSQRLSEQRAEEIRQGLNRLKLASAWREQGLLHAEQLRWRDAHADLTKAIELRPDEAANWVARVDLLTDLGLWDLAAADFAREFEVREPDSTMRWYRSAIVRLSVGDSAGYHALCLRMCQRFNGTANRHFATEVVRTCVLSPNADADLRPLVKMAERHLAGDPTGWYPLYLLGVANYRAGKYDEAARRLEASLTGTPEWSARELSCPILAMAYHRLGRTHDAEQTLSTAAEALDRWTRQRYPVPDWRWMDHFGVAVQGTVKWWDVLECQHYYSEAHALLKGSAPPEIPLNRVLRARALATLGRFEQAAQEYSSARRLCPSDSRILLETHRNQGCGYVASGQWSRAAEEFTAAAELQPDDVYHWLFRAAAHLGAGDVQAYRQTCVAMVQHFEDTEDPRSARYTVYTCVMRPDALPDVACLMPLARTADPAWNGDEYMLAAALYRAAHFDEALRCFDATAKTYPPRASHCCFWAMAHHRLGNANEARRRLDEAKRWIAEANHQTHDHPSSNAPTWAAWYEHILYPLLIREAETLLSQDSPSNTRNPEK